MTFDFAKHKDELLFIPLGGSNEIGMNMNLYAIDGKWLMVDCGIGFAGEYLPGVEVIVPDISVILENKENLLGMVITHAHEDHLGAVPYLWRDLECPIYTTKFTAAFLRNKISEMGAGKKPKIHEIACGGSVDLDPFKIEFIELTHSIAEMQAVAITTRKGVVLHTGDWKFDDAPMIGSVSDVDALKRYGDGKVLAMVCDSTNVFEEGHSGSEGEVREHLVSLVKSCKKRVVVATFASNIARVATLIHAAQEAGRMVALAGRSLHRVIDAAKSAGYIDADMEFLDESEAMNIPREDLLLICTGCQGEPRAALSRISRGDHPYIRLQPEDTVIFSSRKIPGNETKINAIQNRLVKNRVEVITDRNYYIHVSGHPARGELQRMYELVRPQIAVPTHGEPRHLHEHVKFARSLGVKETVEAHNGAVIWLEEGEASIIGEVHSGYIAIDGSSMLTTDGGVIRTRRKLRDDGVVFVSVVMNKNGDLEGEVQLVAPGVLDEKEDAEIIEEYASLVADALEKLKKNISDEAVKEAARLTIRRAIKRDLDKKPVIEVLVTRV